MSKLNFGRLMFFVGVFMALGIHICSLLFPEDVADNKASLMITGGILAGIGVITLFLSRPEAEAEFNKMEAQEIAKQARREQADARRIAYGGWSDWEEFSQYRRRHGNKIEFRRSNPACMVLCLLLLGAAVDMIFLGWFLPEVGLAYGALAVAIGVIIFPIGQGVTIDGTSLQIVRWWGWVFKPFLRHSIKPEIIVAVWATKKLGMKSPEADVGRSVRFPLYLLFKNNRRLLLKAFLKPDEARNVGADVARMVKAPLRVELGDD